MLRCVALLAVSLSQWHPFGTASFRVFQVRGYGLSGDAFHVTQPAPDGRGAILAMKRALDGSNVSPADVAYINAHATSTPLGDAIEAAAIAKVFEVGPASSGGAGGSST